MSTSTRTRIRLFPSKVEVATLLVPVLFLVLTVVDLLFIRLITTGGPGAHVNRLVASLFFFNSIHVYFTFAALLTLPEMREWIHHSTEGRSHRFWIHQGVASIVIGLAIGIVFFKMPIAGLPFLHVLILGIIPRHHVIKQTLGLSLLYNARLMRQPDITPAEKARINEVANVERKGFTLFMWLFWAYLILSAYERKLLPFAGSIPHWVLFAGASTVAIVIVLNALRYPRVRQHNKLFFLSRLLFYPLLPFSVFADAALRSCHGTEYLAVTTVMGQNSKAGPSVVRKFWVLVGGLGLLGALLMLCRDDGVVAFFYGGSYADVPVVLQALAFVSFTLTYTHFYIDSQLFKFRQATNREHVLPLFG